MNKLIATAALGLAALLATAQTATNFNVPDCHGEMHDLFAELDAGKVIVIDWVMPCAACTGPSLTTYNVVQSYQASHPDQVLMYVVDDYANTNCSSLNTWKSNIGIPNTVSFSNAAIDMDDYGGPGMPKIVVLGGTDHAVFYNADNAVDATALQNAINQALLAAAVPEENGLAAGFSVQPVPAGDQARVDYTLERASVVDLGLYDLTGKRVRTIYHGALPPGTHHTTLTNSHLAAGSYVVRITDGRQHASLQLPIAH